MAEEKKTTSAVTVSSTSITIDVSLSNLGIGAEIDISPYTLHTSHIHIFKEMYKPCYVELEMTFDNWLDYNQKDYAYDLRSYFLKEGMTLNVINGSGDYVVKDYYVCDMHIGQKKQTEAEKGTLTNAIVYVTIRAYSPDFFLTLKKYSKTYRSTNNTLSQIIFDKVKTVSEIYNEDNSIKRFDTNKLHLCHTMYKLGEESKELIQPYLVQYNESFHDFVVRVANRCGELFYYEDGELHLGVAEENLDSNNAPILKFEEYLDPIDISFSNVPSGYTNDDVTNLSQSLVEKNPNVAAIGKLYNVNNVATYDALRATDKTKDSLTSDDLEKCHLLDPFTSVLSSDGLVSGLTNGIEKYFENFFNEKVLMSSVCSGITLSDDTVNKENSYFSNIVDKTTTQVRNLTNAYYDRIDKIERHNSEKVYVGKLTAIPEKKLGQFGRFKSFNKIDRTYYVYSIDLEFGSYSTDSGVNNADIDGVIKYAPVLLDNEMDTSRSDDETNFQLLVYPLLADIPHIRKAQPQQAIVTDIGDPLRYGRVQIRYPWSYKVDDESSSPWISVATPFAGNKGDGSSGMLMTPDVGDYVIIDYEGGNVERPFVAGSLYNIQTNWGDTPLVAARWKYGSGHHAITRNGNGITWEDGTSNLFVGGLLPGFFTPWILNDPTYKKEHSWTTDPHLAGGMRISDYYGIYSIAMSSASRSISIDSPWGTVSINAFSGITLSAPNGDIKISGKNVTIEAGNEVSITSGKNIKSEHFFDAFQKNAVNPVIAAATKVGAAALTTYTTNKEGLNGLNIGKILDVSFIRSVYEIVFRPVNGSLSLTSKRNVQVTAGGGKVTTPSDTLSKASKPAAGKLSWAAIPLAGWDLQHTAAEEQKEAEKRNAGYGLMLVTQRMCGVVTSGMHEIQRSITSYRAQLNDIIKEFIDQTVVDNHPRAKKIAAQDWNSRNCIITQSMKVVEPDINGDNNFFAGDDGEEHWKENRLNDFTNKFHRLWETADYIRSIFSKDVSSVLMQLENCMKEERYPDGVLAACDFDDKDFYQAIWTEDNVSSSFNNNVRNPIVVKFNTENLNNFIKCFTDAAHLNSAIVVMKMRTLHAVLTASLNVKDYTNEQPANVPAFDGDIEFTRHLGINGAPSSKSTLDKVLGGASSLMGSVLSGAGLSDLASYDDATGRWSIWDSGQKLFNFNGKAGPRSLWDVSHGRGAVLISGDKGHTFKVGKGDDEWKDVKAVPDITVDDIVKELNLQ